MLSEPSERAAHSAKSFPNPRKGLRAPRKAFRTLGKGCALREKLSEPSERAAHAAKSFPNPRKGLRAPQKGFRILGRGCALRETLPDTSETFTFRKTKGNPRLRSIKTLDESSPLADLNQL